MADMDYLRLYWVVNCPIGLLVQVSPNIFMRIWKVMQDKDSI